MRWILTLLGSGLLSIGCIHPCFAQARLAEAGIKVVGGDDSIAEKPLVAAEPISANATHEVISTVSVTGDSGKLQTLAGMPDGQIVALVSAGRILPSTTSESDAPLAEIHLLDSDGNRIRKWPLDFLAQSVSVDPRGQIYVAGDGQIARYSSEGKLLAKADIPHIAEVLRDQDKLRDQAEAQIKAQSESYERAIDQMKKQIEQLEAKEDELTDLEEQQLKAQRVNLGFYEQLRKSRKAPSVESVMKALMGRLRIINSVTATDSDVFIACGESKGYGYAVWRMDHNFKNAEQVLSRLGGCCGQMDVQAHGEHLFVALNTKHRVGQYDRDGEEVTSFGKRDRVSEGECFAGCCNPMNCRVTASGDIYTAESEGIVKKFNSQGEFIALIGKVKLTGGCKNVAVVASPSGDKVYFCDLPGSRIIILGERKAATKENAAE